MHVKVHIPPFQSHFKLVVSRQACTNNQSKYTINGRASAYDEVQPLLYSQKKKAISISKCPLGTFSPSTFDTSLRRTQTEVTDLLRSLRDIPIQCFVLLQRTKPANSIRLIWGKRGSAHYCGGATLRLRC